MYKSLRSVLSLTAIAILMLAPASATEYDGERLGELCIARPDVVEAYVEGFVDKASRDREAIELQFKAYARSNGQDPLQTIRMQALMDAMEGYCLPVRNAAKNTAAQVCKHIAEMPEDDRQYDGAYLARRALREAWPCSSK